MFSDCKNYLNFDFSINYWSDEGGGIASDILDDFSESDWNELLQAWQEQAVEWRVRCAETIDSQSHPAVAKILVAMLYDPDDNVRIAAVDSLRSLDALVLEPEDIELISELKERFGPVCQAVINDLLRKFGGASGF